jgi:YD repeat-containing protein
VNYSYDNASRLTQIAQGASAVSFVYDTANRRTSLTLPNGVVMSYSYDKASQLSAINYQLGTNTLGNLTYTYDLAGRRTSMGGSYAAANLPQPVSLTAGACPERSRRDAANELTEWGAATPVYDANGNTLSDGTNSYAWNGRNQLASMNSSAESFQYDPLGRRAAKTALFGTTNYLYDGTNPVQELAGTTPTANLLTGLNVDEYFQPTGPRQIGHFAPLIPHPSPLVPHHIPP